MYETGKLLQTIKEMNFYNLVSLGIAKARWTKTGRQKLGTGMLIIGKS